MMGEAPLPSHSSCDSKSQHEFTDSHLLLQNHSISRLSGFLPCPLLKEEAKETVFHSALFQMMSFRLATDFNPLGKKKKVYAKATFAIVTVEFHGQK